MLTQNFEMLMFIAPCIIAIIDEWKTNLMSLVTLFYLLSAQHVSDINISIFRSLRLCWWITTSVILLSVRCVLEFLLRLVFGGVRFTGWSTTLDSPNLLMTNLLQFTMTVRKSHRQPQRTLQLVCEGRVLFVWADLHVPLCGQQHPNCKRAIRLVYPPFFRTLRSASNPQTKI